MKTVVLYPGRFQPMLPHHAEVYRHLQSEFPDAEVYITTSNKVEAGKSPFDANDKIEIMTDLHGIPQDRILITKSPYNWKEYENSFDANNTKLIFVVGGKDMEGNPRFNFNPLKDGSPSYLQMINTFVIPQLIHKYGQNVNGTLPRLCGHTMVLQPTGH